MKRHADTTAATHLVYLAACSALALAACSGGGGGARYYGPTEVGDLAVSSHDLAGEKFDLGGERPDIAMAMVDMQVGPTCNDGMQNGQETDIDCGGPQCNPCQDGGNCDLDRDCASQSCVNNTCIPAATCNDGIQNGSETDVDCGGGSCPPCDNGDSCAGNQDCSSGQCTTNVCCGLGTLNCDGNKFSGCNIDSTSDSSNCGSCGHACGNGQSCKASKCVIAQKMMVGSYTVGNGPAWANAPAVVSCVQECAVMFGGAAGSYSCSTSNANITSTANLSCYGVGGCQIKADNYSAGPNYTGMGDCSAYIADNCLNTLNYCWR